MSTGSCIMSTAVCGCVCVQGVQNFHFGIDVQHQAPRTVSLWNWKNGEMGVSKTQISLQNAAL